MAEVPDWAAAPDWAADEKPAAAPPKSMLEKAVEPITSYPSTQIQMAREAREQIGHGVKQLGSPSGAWDVAKGAGNVALGSLGYVASPISAAYRTVVGKPVEDITGIPKEYTEFAAGLATPGIGLTRLPRAPVPQVPAVRRGPLDVVLSEGQATGELPLIQREQAALRGQTGGKSEAAAKAFADQQRAQIEAAHGRVAEKMDPFGSTIAETPYEAADLASRSFRDAAAQRKAGVTAAYDYAKALPGEIHAGAFEGVGQRIKNTLSMADEPIVVDDLTPRAGKAIKYIEDKIAALEIPNKANLAKPDALGAIREGRYAGVSLSGIDQWRKNLVAMRNDAMSAYATNPTDARAMRAVINAFDDHVDTAIRNGAFSGDPRAVRAWWDARAAHAEYKTTFGKGKGDRVGTVVQRVLGDKTNPPAIANDVADHLYGAVGTNPNSLNLGVARRFRDVLGPSSPEWSGVKQGLWSRLTEKAGADFGPKQTADRINKFLNHDGREMAEFMYSPAQREAMQAYADLMRKITVPQAGANWSNTGAAKVFQKISGTMGMLIGGVLGHTAGSKLGLPFPIGEAVGAGLAKVPKRLDEAREARAIARQMPVIANQMQNWQRAMSRHQAAPSSTTQRLVTGAAVNLDQTLRKLGTSLSEMTMPVPQMPAMGRADENGIPRPPPEKNNGGAVGEQQRLAHGGPVRGYAEGGGPFDETLPTQPEPSLSDAGEWATVPRTSEGRPQITVTPRPEYTDEQVAALAGQQVTPNISEQIGSGVRHLGSEMVQGYKDMVSPFTKDDAGKYVADQPLPEDAYKGKVPQTQKDPVALGLPFGFEVASNLAGPPGKGMAWGLLKSAAPAAMGAVGKVMPKPNPMGFYSAVEHAVEALPLQKGHPSQWLGTIKNQAGLKAEELEWMGLEDWLKQQSGPVTKDAVLDYIRANRIEVNEIEKVEKRTSVTGRTLFQDRDEAAQRLYQTPYDKLASEQKRAVDDELASKSPTKFSQWQMPGGSNYRELLLTLPDRTGSLDKRKAIFDKYSNEIRAVHRQLETPGIPNRSQLEAERIRLEDIRDREADAAAEVPTNLFRTSHWDEPNVLAHIRFNDRVIDGKKTLFVEEFQSDWHQKGRKGGYDTGKQLDWNEHPQPDGGKIWVANRDDYRFQVKQHPDGVIEATMNGVLVNPSGHASIAEAKTAAERYLTMRGGSQVPDAPFKTTWPELSLKRMIRYAAENGYDAIAWTPGEVQAARYDLSKHIKEIEYIKNRDGTYKLGITGKNGEGVNIPNGDRMSLTDIENTVGKEIAEKISKEEGRKYRGHEGYTLDGLDLKVGGEGMLSFYDRELPNKANAIAKKYGAKVERRKMETADQKLIDEELEGLEAETPEQQAILDAATKETPTTKNVHFLELPKSLRDDVMTKGQRLFARGGAVAIKRQPSVWPKIWSKQKRAANG